MRLIVDRTRFMGDARAWPVRLPQTGQPGVGVPAVYEDVTQGYPNTPLPSEKLGGSLVPFAVEWGRTRIGIGLPPRPGAGPDGAEGSFGPAPGVSQPGSCAAGRGPVVVCSQPTYRPNWNNLCLGSLVGLWERVYSAGGPRHYCDPTDYRTCGVPPWQQMPAGGRRFQRVGTLAIAGLAEGIDYTVLSFRVPFGWDGVLITVTNQFNGLGFVDGSGSVHWRVMFDGQWYKDMGDVTITLGRLETPYELEGGGYRITSGQTLRYIARLGAGALGILDPLGIISCALSGWFYPRS